MKLRLTILISAASLLAMSCHHESAPIVVGSKNFTESVILGELLAQRLEASGCKVDRRLNMGGSLVCDSAIGSGAIDTYVEYSGTALTAILHQPVDNRGGVMGRIETAYKKRGLHFGPALGFNDTFAMIVRRTDAARDHLQRVSDLQRVAGTIRPGFGYEFAGRPDGWNGLVKRYGLQVATAPKTMDLGLTYKALATNQIDLIAGNSTDGLIASLGLVVLEDDLHYFPPYDAAIVYRNDIDKKCSAATTALATMINTIDDSTMRSLNYEVDGKKRDVAEVVREALKRR